jgi:hypothetical protein
MVSNIEVEDVFDRGKMDYPVRRRKKRRWKLLTGLFPDLVNFPHSLYDSLLECIIYSSDYTKGLLLYYRRERESTFLSIAIKTATMDSPHSVATRGV